MSRTRPAARRSSAATSRPRHGRPIRTVAGPAWANSLFEDNAEFGYGFRVTLDKLGEYARHALGELAPAVGEELAGDILNAAQQTGTDLDAQRGRLAELRSRLERIPDPRAKDLHALADHLLERVVWIVGGDGWAYDIGFGGLDHVLASDRDVNILVMDTEVYSNTGGQKSKATPRAATAKFATGGKFVAKKDLGMIAVDYGHVYVAQIAFGADPKQTVRAMQEAAAHKGPSLLVAYATCIAHGFDLTYTIEHMQAAVESGYWPLYRFNPNLTPLGRNPMELDSEEPSISFKDYATMENRYRVLAKANPDEAEELMDLAQADVLKRWQHYQRLADGADHLMAAKPRPIEIGPGPNRFPHFSLSREEGFANQPKDMDWLDTNIPCQGRLSGAHAHPGLSRRNPQGQLRRSLPDQPRRQRVPGRARPGLFPAVRGRLPSWPRGPRRTRRDLLLQARRVGSRQRQARDPRSALSRNRQDRRDRRRRLRRDLPPRANSRSTATSRPCSRSTPRPAA